jgi:archaellum component FlaC
MNYLLDVLAKLDNEMETEGLQGTLRVEIKEIERRIRDIETTIAEMTTELEAMWSESKDFAYELSSVFMHR